MMRRTPKGIYLVDGWLYVGREATGPRAWKGYAWAGVRIGSLRIDWRFRR